LNIVNTFMIKFGNSCEIVEIVLFISRDPPKLQVTLTLETQTNCIMASRYVVLVFFQISTLKGTIIEVITSHTILVNSKPKYS